MDLRTSRLSRSSPETRSRDQSNPRRTMDCDRSNCRTDIFQFPARPQSYRNAALPGIQECQTATWRARRSLFPRSTRLATVTPLLTFLRPWRLNDCSEVLRPLQAAVLSSLLATEALPVQGPRCLCPTRNTFIRNSCYIFYDNTGCQSPVQQEIEQQSRTTSECDVSGRTTATSVRMGCLTDQLEERGGSPAPESSRKST